MRPPLPAFPAAHADHPHAPAELLRQGIGLRPVVAADLPFLRVLYGETRAAELAPVPWPPAAKQAFLDDQFDLQHRHYLAYFGAADFLLVERNGQPVGRLYLLRESPDYRVVDIALRVAAQRQGLASALLADIQRQAAAHGCGVALHVDRHNPDASRLYQRLGFVVTDDDGGTHLPMRWSGAAIS